MTGAKGKQPDWPEALKRLRYLWSGPHVRPQHTRRRWHDGRGDADRARARALGAREIKPRSRGGQQR